MGIRGQRVDLATIEQISRLRKVGLSQEAIVRELRISSRTVRKYLPPRANDENAVPTSSAA